MMLGILTRLFFGFPKSAATLAKLVTGASSGINGNMSSTIEGKTTKGNRLTAITLYYYDDDMRSNMR